MGRDREEIKWRFIVLFPLLFYRFEMCHNNRFKINKGTMIMILLIIIARGFFCSSSVPDPVLNTFHTYLI